MDTETKRRSRWVDPPTVTHFSETDLEICKLLTPVFGIRDPWGYGYLPSSYFSGLLNRGVKGTPKRVSELRGKPHYVELAEQPRNNYRQQIFRLSDAGEDEVAAAAGGLKIRRHPRAVSHELMACIIAASFEVGAREYGTSITLHPKLNLPIIPDWPIFDFAGRTVFIEADTGSMTINPKNESEASSIRLKYEHYLKLLHDQKLGPDALFLFVTTREHRCGSLIETLKFTIDKFDCPHEYADQFAFTSIEYDRFLNTIPVLSAWAVTRPYLRAGCEPFRFIKGR